MRFLFKDISEVYTPLQRIGEAAMAVEEGIIRWIGAADELPETYRNWPDISLGNRGILPGLIDCHTHLVWGGNRLDEYTRRARGESYEEILEAGGGIYNTVMATRAASEDQLFSLALERAHHFLQEGVTTLEVKSGYGLEPEAELKMLRVVKRLDQHFRQRFFPTLLAHVVPREWDRVDYLRMFCNELIPTVARENLATAVDVFCDRGAFSIAETRKIFEAALDSGLAIKAHAEQLTHSGATRLVAEMKGLSADHLEQTTADDWRALALHGTVGTILPGATVILRKAFPDLGAMRDAGVALAVATDHNPGSSHLYSLMLCLQLASALGGLSVEEALASGTATAGRALGRPELGNLKVASPADFVVVDGPDALSPFYHWGKNCIKQVYVGGDLAWRVG
ncbi:MAG TPA: imidazolonepropionase [Calditrichia bacterium]|nr:imidazolonepropionase [Calditrichia bacterium]